jgi:REP element-mobilizing transposase RayT
VRSVETVPRSPRSSLPDGLFHVTVRGNRKAEIMLDDIDAELILRKIEDATARVEWRWLMYCVMPNHLHLLLDARVPQLSKGMQLLSGGFAQWFNRRHDVTGHHFEGRFKSRPIVRGPHLFETIRYIALNPVRAGLCPHASLWPWSSYGALIGTRPSRDCLASHDVRTLFGNDSRRAIARIRAFVEGE